MALTSRNISLAQLDEMTSSPRVQDNEVDTLSMPTNSRTRRPARGRNHSSLGRNDFSSLTGSLPHTQNQFVMMSQQPSQLTDEHYLQTIAKLSDILLVRRDRDQVGLRRGRTQLHVTTCKAEKKLAIQVYDNVGRFLGGIYAGHRDNKLEVRLFEETYCIDVAEVSVDGKLIRRWSFFPKLDNMQNLDAARNIWNHIKRTCGYMPVSLTRLISDLSIVGQPQRDFDFRQSTREQRDARQDLQIGHDWVIEVPQGVNGWTFGGFYAKNNARMERIRYGDTDLVDDEDEPEWGDRSTQPFVVRRKTRKQKRGRKATKGKKRQARQDLDNEEEADDEADEADGSGGVDAGGGVEGDQA